MTISQESYRFFPYKPLKWVQISFSANFAVLTIIQISSLVYTHRRYRNAVKGKRLRNYVRMMFPFVFGLVLECVAYAARAVSSDHSDSVVAFVTQSLFLQIAPSLVAATAYVCFDALLTALNAESHSCIAPNYLTFMLIVGEIFCNVLNCFGGALKGYVDDKIGTVTIFVSLLLKMILLSVFIANIIIFCSGYRKQPTKRGVSLTHDKPLVGNWRHGLVILLLSSIFLLIRIAYRSITCATDGSNRVNSNEVFLFVLDGSMTLIACAIMSTINFSYLFSMIDSEYTSVYETRDTESMNTIL